MVIVLAILLLSGKCHADTVATVVYRLLYSHKQDAANTYNYVMFGVDWAGMSDPDGLIIANMLITGEMHNFEQVSDRLHQSASKIIR